MAYIYDLTDTWNAGATTFNAIRMNVTDTASSVSSKLVTLQVSGTERFSVTKAGVGYFSGKVGIGTSLPGSKLQIAGTGGEGFVTVSDNTQATVRLSLSGGAQSDFTMTDLVTILRTNAGQPLLFGTSATERMRIDSSGNVGIGTSSPLAGYRVDVAGSVNSSASFVSGGGTANQAQIGNKVLLFYNTSVSEGFIQSADDTSTFNSMGFSKATLRFLTSNAERARIDSSGNLLVGTTALPSGSGTSGVGIRNVSGVIGQIIIGKTQSGTVDAQTFYYSGTYVGGIQISNTATSLITSSDVRLKHDIIDAPEASNLIDAIQVRSFKWNTDNTEQRYGFVAQELIEVAPEAVSQPADPDKMMGVDYSKLVPMLVKEIQSLRARVAQLEGN